MRKNELIGWRLPQPWAIAFVVAAGLVLTCAPVRAADDDDEPIRDDSLMGNIMRGIGGTNSSGIQYRERSPLVVPRQLTLPPPQSRKTESGNWPKDPDVLERRAIREAQKNYDWRKDINPRPLLPSELEPVGIARARSATSSPQPGVREESPRSTDNKLLPSALGYTGGLFNFFGGNKAANEAKFTGEPSRDSLTQPPSGYQTPSPGYAYGSDARPQTMTRSPMDDRAIQPPR